MRSAKALTVEQAKDLLPETFCPANKHEGGKKLIQTSKGVMAFHQSSQLRDGGWKTSHPEEDIRKDIDYVLFAVGYEGILILSRQLLLSFYDFNYKSRYANNGYPIHIFKQGERYVWRGRDGNWLDVTECFVKA
ncbi:MAG: hypothetical protein K2K23_08780 [Muribaculaceae bacterium]|nr:hypothetical protein [Muribaculaceae bacterium]